MYGHIRRIYRVGQNHIYTVCIRYFWQENHQKYGHIRCIYTVLANPIYIYIYGSGQPYPCHKQGQVPTLRIPF